MSVTKLEDSNLIFDKKVQIEVLKALKNIFDEVELQNKTANSPSRKIEEGLPSVRELIELGRNVNLNKGFKKEVPFQDVGTAQLSFMQASETVLNILKHPNIKKGDSPAISTAKIALRPIIKAGKTDLAKDFADYASVKMFQKDYSQIIGSKALNS